MLALDARTSNLGSSVVFIHVLDGAAASTERSVGSCTRPLSSSSRRSPTRLGSALSSSSSRRTPTRLGLALGVGSSSSSLRSVHSYSSSRSPIRLDLECKAVRPHSPETLLARQRFVLSDGCTICFYGSFSLGNFSLCNGHSLCDWWICWISHFKISGWGTPQLRQSNRKRRSLHQQPTRESGF